ncbi:MAG: ABC transporter permease [Actinomycetia bacterium]|nr:ABC transporter permease [Actinomycetes bacterium]MCP4958593.1 ABC transporter permease [Actinomycetes bacterium]
MGRYVIRRTLFAIPTLLAISFIIFMILDLAPGDPTSNLPLTIPAEQRERIRENLGLDDPPIQKWMAWNELMFINEPLELLNDATGICVGECEDRDRIISWSSSSPAMDTIWQRLPQTLWVLGLAFLIGTMLAIPIGIYSAYKQYSAFDNIGTVVTMIGFSVPTFFTGLLAIVFFSVKLGWFPSFYDSTHDTSFTSWSSIWFQMKQLIMPVTVLTLFNTAALSRYARASVLDNLNADFVRTARAKGVGERGVVLIHVMRNSLIPVVTLITLSIPAIFSGAIITEQIFRINGLGALLISAINGSDVPMTQTLTFMFAVLIVLFNLVNDVLIGFLDPRIRYD